MDQAAIVKTSNSLFTNALVLDVRLAREAMTSADHPRHFKALDCGGSRLHGLEAPNWANDSFERYVVRLNNVVQVLAGAMLRRT